MVLTLVPQMTRGGRPYTFLPAMEIRVLVCVEKNALL